MTYLEYHLIFNLPLLLLLYFLVRRRVEAQHFKWLGILLLVVTLFTYPWDSNAVSRGIWGFGEGRVAFFVGNLPFEEVLFFLLETIAVTFLVIYFLPKPKPIEGEER